MSHTYEASNGTTFNYNADLSGRVQIVTSGGDPLRHYIDGADLLEFILEAYVRPFRITQVEQMTTAELLAVMYSGPLPKSRLGPHPL